MLKSSFPASSLPSAATMKGGEERKKKIIRKEKKRISYLPIAIKGQILLQI